MGFLDRLRKQEPEPFDPLADLVLGKLKIGYLVDYDLRTWVVTDHTRYRFNDGRTAEEWELTADRDKRYLERGGESGDSWSLSRTLPINALSGDVRQHILDHDEVPEAVTFEDTTYYLDGSSGGEILEDVGKARQEFIQWELLDEAEEHFVSIMQWSETEVTAVAGSLVEEYQFTDILPGEAP